MATWHAEAEALERAHWECVGWCLQYKLPVFEGTEWRGLWEMREDIREHRKAHNLDPHTGDPLPPDPWQERLLAMVTEPGALPLTVNYPRRYR